MGNSLDEVRKRLGALQAEIERLETAAGVRGQVAALGPQHTFDALRPIYFAIPDIEQRKALIAAVRSYCEYRQRNEGPAMEQDVKAHADKLAAKVDTVPWVIPAALGVMAVGIGVSLAGIYGAMAGVLVGFFFGQAYVSAQRKKTANAYAKARAHLEDLQAIHLDMQMQRNAQLGRPGPENLDGFSYKEEAAGLPDPVEPNAVDRKPTILLP